MDADFWHGKWAKNEIGFHESAANPLLVRHFPALGLTDGDVEADGEALRELVATGC